LPINRKSYRELAPRLRAGACLAGTFVKTPTPHATEILGLLGFDFVVFDMEHAAIDLGSLDRMILGARAANVAAVVRVPEGNPPAILSALDLGATGILVPHVSSRAIAQTIVASCRYKDGKRGFANTTRAGNYGLTGFEAHKASQDHETACIAMIEDLEAVAVIDDILSVPGLDAVFIGRGDLTAALGCEAMNDPKTMAVVRPIMAAAKRHKLPVIAICMDGEMRAPWLRSARRRS
jgi:2-keto-3-deoxy-L-rhamnonate aldolase RhmA